MENYLNIIRGARSYITIPIEEFSVDQLNEIPAGFKNNFLWNFRGL